MFTSKFIDIDKKNLFSTSLEYNSTNIPIVKKEPLKLELEDFLNSVRNGSSPLVSGNDGINNIKVIEAAHASLQQGKKIKIKEKN